jgi:hypothetical protein
METLVCARCGTEMTAEVRLPPIVPGRAALVFFLCECDHVDKKIAEPSEPETASIDGFSRSFLLWATKSRNHPTGRFSK